MVGVPRSKGCRVLRPTSSQGGINSCSCTSPLIVNSATRPAQRASAASREDASAPGMVRRSSSRMKAQSCCSTSQRKPPDKRQEQVPRRRRQRERQRETIKNLPQSRRAPSKLDPDPLSIDQAALMVHMRQRPNLFTVFENSATLLSDHDSNVYSHQSDLTQMAHNSMEDLFHFSPQSALDSPLIQQNQLLYTFTSSISPRYQFELDPSHRGQGRWLHYLPTLSGVKCATRQFHPFLHTCAPWPPASLCKDDARVSKLLWKGTAPPEQ